MMQIRRFRDDDAEQIIQLFYNCFGREMSKNEWIWKYKKSPWGSVAYVAVDGRELVSYYGAIKFAISYQGTLLSAYQACDVMTHPDYRARIFSKKPLIVQTAELFYKENVMDFTFGFPSERNARLHHLVMGWSQHRKVALFKKDLNVKNINNLSKYKPYILRIGWDKVNSKDLDEVWNGCSKSLSLSILKESKYLFWRYMDNPSHFYTLLTLKDIIKKTIVSSAIVKSSDSELYIVDFFYNGREIFPYFWQLLETYAIKIQAKAINVWINYKEDIAKDLIALGYKINEDAPFALRIMNRHAITSDDFYTKYRYRIGDLL
jgi:hypothetical protein